VALANLDAALFSVLGQAKLLFTAVFARAVLKKNFRYIQMLSLVLLTVGVMMCNMNSNKQTDEESNDNFKGICATLGIAFSSGFASVYIEKVIKSQRAKSPVMGSYYLAYIQVQLAVTSLVTIGLYAFVQDFEIIIRYGLFHKFDTCAFF
jgi:UDP-sugar transporter A1/2/3